MRSQPRRRRSQNRRLSHERLERRDLLAGDTAEWLNPVQPWDTNNDGQFGISDVFSSIDAVRERGFGDLPLRPPAEEQFIDTNGDNQFNPVDVFTQIDAIRREFAPAPSLADPLYVEAQGNVGQLQDGLGELDFSPIILVGDPDGDPAVTAQDRVDPNTPTSAFSGVVSLKMVVNEQDSFSCTGTLISPTHVLTAAHCLDYVGGVDPAGGSTGDGVADFAANSVTVFFNHDNPHSTPEGAHYREVVSISLHEDWHGFNNVNGPEEGGSIHDDIAILQLTEPAPVPAQVYSLVSQPMVARQSLVLAGYGRYGNGVEGVQGASNRYVKRTGQNFTAHAEFNEEGPGLRELFLFDFDGEAEPDVLQDGETLGNAIEVSVYSGDSGGPSFNWHDADGDLEVDHGELVLFGVNTFVAPSYEDGPDDRFGALGGGMIVGGYADFISNTLGLDFGDAPDSGLGVGADNYQTSHADNGPRHIAVGPQLGNLRDVETDSQHAESDGDNSANEADEDGLVIGDLEQGKTVLAEVSSSGNQAKLDYFVDWNQDGQFAAEESYQATLNNVVETIEIHVPEDADLGETIARFRISSAGGYGPTGLAFDGEIEDYLVTVTEPIDNQPPVIQPQDAVSGELRVTWTGGGGTTEIFVYTDPTDWNTFVKKQKVFGGKTEMLIGGLDDGQYYVSGRTIYWDDNQWNFTSLTSPKVPYEVSGPRKQPVVLPQQQVNGDLEIEWRDGVSTTEVFVFQDAVGWDNIVEKHKVYGGGKDLVISELPDGEYFVAARGIYWEDEQWKFTPLQHPRVSYEVSGDGKHPLVQDQTFVSGDLEAKWVEGVETTEVLVFREPTGWDSLETKQKAYGGDKELAIPDLDDGTYYVATRGIYWEDEAWKFTGTSRRAIYRVEGDGKHPLVQPQQRVSHDLEVNWIEGVNTTEVLVFRDPTGWDSLVTKQKVYGGEKEMTITGLAPGVYYVAARGITWEDGEWRFTAASPRQQYEVAVSGPNASSLLVAFASEAELPGDRERNEVFADPFFVDEFESR